jgi:hypothetical protein
MKWNFLGFEFKPRQVNDSSQPNQRTDNLVSHGSYLTLVSSSTHMSRRTHRGWPDTIPYNIHKEVGYRPTRRHMKLLSLGIPHVSYAPVHFKCLFNMDQPTRALIDTDEGYHLWASNIRSDHSSTFPSSILHFPLIARSGLILNHSTNYSSSQHSNLEPGYKSPKSQEWSLPLDFYQSSIH